MSNSAKEKKVRVFDLAKELDMASKDLVAIAQELGYAAIKNQLNGLEPAQVDALKERVKKGAPAKPTAAGLTRAPGAAKPAPLPPPGKIEQKVVTLPATKPKPAPVRPAPPADPVPPAAEPTPVAEVAPPVADPVPPAPEPAPAVVAETKAAAQTPPPNIIPTAAGSGMRNLNAGVRNLNAAPRPLPPKPTPAAPTAPKPPAPTPAAATDPVAPVAEAPKPAAVVPPPAAVPPTPAQPPAPQVPPPNIIPTARPGTGGVPTLGGNAPRPASLDRRPNPPPPRNLGSGPVAPRPGGGMPGGGTRPGGQPTGGMPPRPAPSGPGTSNPGGPPRPGIPGRPPAPPKAGTPMKLTPEMIQRLRDAQHTGKKVTLDQLNKQPTPGAPGTPGGPPRPGGPARPGFSISTPRPMDGTDGSGGPEDEDGKKKAGPGGVIGRDSRHKGRQQATGRARPSPDGRSVIIGAGGQVETIESQWGSRRGPRAALLRKAARRGQQVVTIKEGRIEIPVPINIRSLSETIGMKVGELTKRLLKETGKLYAITSILEFEIAALIAAEKNIELVAKKVETAEEKLLREFEEQAENVDEAKLLPRPPIVTIMGHVDHGKTSLLDKIRANYGIESDVVSTEAGGITQVIRAWSVKREVEIERDGEPVIEDRFITFLDTPGHEAFTKMRARGANVTDIAVIVVAATDGVMPQTQEAISHAKAAEVKIIVAINKTDMPNSNVAKTRQQLYGEGLIPDDMGGDVQFVETSAVTGKGIAELLDTIVLVAEVEDLKADPDRAAMGTCLEAYMSADEGVTATVLVQQGTLHKGDIILCGSTFGRVRAMYNDMAKPTNNAGPSTPVRITGLGAVPNADDPFYVVDELTKAKGIAEAREKKDRDDKLNRFTTVTLENLSAVKAKAKITELKIILKAEARGSVEAIRKELEKLVHEEVRTRVLHAGIGAITESDVELALTSPDDTLVIGFNVTADDAALRLAEARHVSIREYDIIYKLTDDVKSALEGKLKPIEEVVHLGRAVIRQTFKVGKVGTIAGCYVTSGTIERSARIRVIREGVVVFPPSDKVIGLESLKRFKDDAKEVREGFECGLRISGYDDVKVGDVIEAFKIESRARTL